MRARPSYVTITDITPNTLRGQRWPDNEPVVLPKTENDDLEPGGVVQLYLPPYQKRREEPFRVVTKTAAESREVLRLGTGYILTITPRPVLQKERWLRDNPLGQARVAAIRASHNNLSLTQARELLLTEEMPGYARYQAYAYCFSPETRHTGEGPQGRRDLSSYLENYFRNPDFAHIQSQGSPPYRPVKPILLARTLDSNGEVLSCTDFLPKDFERYVERQKVFLAPNQCAEKVLTAMAAVDRWDVLPGAIYTYAQDALRMGDPRAHRAIPTIAALSHQSFENGHYAARPLLLRLSRGPSRVVLETCYDDQRPGCDPRLLANQTPLRPHMLSDMKDMEDMRDMEAPTQRRRNT